LGEKLQWLIDVVETRRKSFVESEQHQQAIRKKLVRDQRERILAKAREDKEREIAELKLHKEKKKKILDREKARRDLILKKNAERMAMKKLKELDEVRKEREREKSKAEQKEQRIRNEKEREEKARHRRMVLHRMKKEQELMAKAEAETRAFEAEEIRIRNWEVTQSKLRKKAAISAEKNRRMKELEELQKIEEEKVLMEEKRRQHEMMMERERKREERSQAARRKKIAEKRIQDEEMAQERARRRKERAQELQERAREGRKNAAKRVSEDIAALKRTNKGKKRQGRKRKEQSTVGKIQKASDLMQVAGLLSSSKKGEHRFAAAASVALWKLKMELAGPQENSSRESVSSRSDGNQHMNRKGGVARKLENARALEDQITRSSISAGREGLSAVDDQVSSKIKCMSAAIFSPEANSIASFLPRSKPSLFKGLAGEVKVQGASTRMRAPVWDDFPLFVRQDHTSIMEAQQNLPDRELGTESNPPVSPLLEVGEESFDEGDLDFSKMDACGSSINFGQPRLCNSVSAPLLDKSKNLQAHSDMEDECQSEDEGNYSDDCDSEYEDDFD